MAAEGEKVDKEKVLPKDAQVVAFSIKISPYFVLCIAESDGPLALCR